MGGSALDVSTYRLEDSDFQATKQKVRKTVHDAFPEAKLHFVVSRRNKEDHGDMDVLVKKGTVDKWPLVELFNPTEYYNNGDIVSLDYDSVSGVRFQLDLVFVREQWWDCAKDFFDWDDLGNLMGKIARRLRFKWGFQGLRYEAYYDENRSVKLGEFMVSQDPEKVYEFLGFDYDRYQQGFDSYEDLFDFVLESKYFSLDAFMPENLTADQRHRDTKRKSYEEFMSYLDKKSPDKRMERWSHEKAVQEADKFFPDANLKGQVEEARRHYEKKQSAKEVLNGHVLMDHFDLEGRELGAAIGKFMDQFEDKNDYYDYLLEVGRDKALADFAKTNNL